MLKLSTTFELKHSDRSSSKVWLSEACIIKRRYQTISRNGKIRKHSNGLVIMTNIHVVYLISKPPSKTAVVDQWDHFCEGSPILNWILQMVYATSCQMSIVFGLVTMTNIQVIMISIF